MTEMFTVYKHILDVQESTLDTVNSSEMAVQWRDRKREVFLCLKWQWNTHTYTHQNNIKKRHNFFLGYATNFQKEIKHKNLHI